MCGNYDSAAAHAVPPFTVVSIVDYVECECNVCDSSEIQTIDGHSRNIVLVGAVGEQADTIVACAVSQQVLGTIGDCTEVSACAYCNSGYSYNSSSCSGKNLCDFHDKNPP